MSIFKRYSSRYRLMTSQNLSVFICVRERGKCVSLFDLCLSLRIFLRPFCFFIQASMLLRKQGRPDRGQPSTNSNSNSNKLLQSAMEHFGTEVVRRGSSFVDVSWRGAKQPQRKALLWCITTGVPTFRKACWAIARFFVFASWLCRISFK